MVVGAVVWLTTVLVFLDAHRRLHPRWPAVETWFGTLLSPVGASRCVYALQWRSLEALHPVEAAAALCDDAELLRIARQWSYDAPTTPRRSAGCSSRAVSPRGCRSRHLDADASPHCPRCGGGYAGRCQRLLRLPRVR